MAAAENALRRTGAELGGVAVTLPDVRLAELATQNAPGAPSNSAQPELGKPQR
jgi:hypothetical protein